MENEAIITAKTPWAGHTGEIPLFLQYFEGSMFDKIAEIAECFPNNVAFDFMGKSTTYREMIAGLEVKECYQLYWDYLDNFRINSVRR